MKCPHCGKDLHKKVTEKNKKIALQLIGDGFQNAAIAKLLQVSKTTVGRWKKAMK